MRALVVRRMAFLAVLTTGLGLSAAGISGLSGMDTSLKLAAATNEGKTALVSERWDGCDGDRAPLPHRI